MFRWLVKPQWRLSGRCWLLIPKVNSRHMYYRLFSVICLWSGLATELNFKVSPEAALVSLNDCGWCQNCRQHREGASRCTHSANSNEAAIGSPAWGRQGALSEVSADELTVDGERQTREQMNKCNVTGWMSGLTKGSESTARGCPTRENFLWPHPIFLSVTLCHVPYVIIIIIKSSHHLVHLHVTSLGTKVAGAGMLGHSGSPMYVQHLQHCSALDSGISRISTEELCRDSNRCGMGVGLNFCFQTTLCCLS